MVAKRRLWQQARDSKYITVFNQHHRHSQPLHNKYIPVHVPPEFLNRAGTPVVIRLSFKVKAAHI